MNSKKRLIIFCLLLLSSSVAYSDIYVGVGGGITQLSEEFVETENLSNGFTLYGGYKLNKFLSAEISYRNFGSLVFKGQEVRYGLRAEVVTPSIHLSLDEVLHSLGVRKKTSLFGRNVTIFASLGLSFWEFDDVPSDASAGPVTLVTDSGKDLTYGLGFDIHIDELWSLRLSTNYTNAGGDLVGDVKFRNYSAGVNRRF